MILEAIVTTLNEDGTPNIAPMGPRVLEPGRRFLLRPYQTSTTYQNLKRTGEGVLHVTDDVLLMAQAAVGTPSPLPALERCKAVDGWVITDACRWYGFRVESLDDSSERTEIAVRVAGQGTLREFFGFNRAKHAVLEAAILATRLAWLTPVEVQGELRRLRPLVEKTGGDREHAAWKFLEDFIAAGLAANAAAQTQPLKPHPPTVGP